MSENKRLSERNTKIAAMLSDGEQLKNFYRFIAQNPYINLHDACQIVIERPDATVCNSMEYSMRPIPTEKNGINVRFFR